MSEAFLVGGEYIAVWAFSEEQLSYALAQRSNASTAHASSFVKQIESAKVTKFSIDAQAPLALLQGSRLLLAGKGVLGTVSAHLGLEHDRELTTFGEGSH